jgi:hypothetical protein
MIFPIIAFLAACVSAVVAVAIRKPAPVAIPVPTVQDEEAVRRAAILSRIRRVGVAPDDLGNLARFR